ncbi:MAG: hypothetical protein HY295_03295 [Thaumarchaeota archaeon]|nr:hypothetical protein [Nitrososphaerota archaeon]
MITPHVETGVADSTVYKHFVHCANDGVLKGIGVAGGEFDHYFKVEIDSQPICDDILCAQIKPVWGNNGIGLDIPFEKQLDVYIRDSIRTPLPTFWTSYVTSHSSFIKQIFKIEKYEDGDYVVAHRTYGDEKDSGTWYVVEVLKGRVKRAQIKLKKDWVLKNEKITGKVVLSNFWNKSEYSDEVIIDLIPAGAITPYQSIVTRSVEGEWEFNFRPIEIPGAFDIRPRLSNFSNYPTRVIVL